MNVSLTSAAVHDSAEYGGDPVQIVLNYQGAYREGVSFLPAFSPKGVALGTYEARALTNSFYSAFVGFTVNCTGFVNLPAPQDSWTFTNDMVSSSFQIDPRF